MLILNLNRLTLISLGGTRMCHFIIVYHRAVEILLACRDALFSLKVRKEERSALFTDLTRFFFKYPDMSLYFLIPFLHTTEAE